MEISSSPSEPLVQDSPQPQGTFTERWGIKPKTVIDRNAGSVLALPPPRVVLTPAQESKIKSAFSSRDAARTGFLEKQQVRELLKELGVPGVTDDALFARYLVSLHNRDSRDADVNQISVEAFLDLFKSMAAPSTQYGERLRRACARGEEEVIRELVARGTNPNLGDGTGQNSIHYAVLQGQVAVINLLKSLCGDSLLIDAKDKRGWSPLFIAVAHDQYEAAELLLALGAKCNVSNVEGRCPLMWACSKGRENMVTVLLANQADPNMTDKSGWTALHYASINGHTGCIKLLLQGGADPALCDILEYPPKHYLGDDAWARLESELTVRRSSRAASIPQSYPPELLQGDYSTLTSGNQQK